MKIIHLSDIHLGSEIKSFPKDISLKRQQLLKEKFLDVIKFSKQNNIHIILLSGDVFDNDDPKKKDKDFFYSVIKDNSDIDFIYLKGNHDLNTINDIQLNNLKCFNNNNWTSYYYDNVCISGIEFDNDNYKNIYSLLSLDSNYINIVMLHGDISKTLKKDGIVLKFLENKNINYLALGHIHRYKEDKLDNNTYYVYPGCLLGRGFDETNDHGFVLLDIDINKKKIQHEYIKDEKDMIYEYDVDISNLNDSYSISIKIKNDYKLDQNNIYRFNLIGEINNPIEDVCDDVARYLKDDVLYVSIKDKSKIKIDIDKYNADISIRGEIIKEVNNDQKISNDDKNTVIRLILEALEGNKYRL